MPSNNPSLPSPSEAQADATSNSHNPEEGLRSSFVSLVQNLLGGERTSSFTEKDGELGFAIDPPVLAGELLSSAQTAIGARFTVKHAIGRGGFGTVYLAHDESLDRDVAIKMPHEKMRGDPQLSSQCLKEARLAAKLRHPSIVTIFDINEDQGRIAYIVQEYVQGATLQDLISKQRLSIRQALHIIVKVAEAIQFAHARGVYHRDLKPANLIVDESGDIRVLDFGLAVDEETQRFSRGQIAGTIAYMSPEQLGGRTHHLDGRTDIWSLGVIFYELLTGRRPFRGTQDEVAEQIVKREVAPPRQFLAAIPKRVEACCMKCLEKSIPARYGTALDLLEELKAIIETEILLDDMPSGPIPIVTPHDTKRLAKDTTKDIPLITIPRAPIQWWLGGAVAVVLGTWLLVQMTSGIVDWFSTRTIARPDPYSIPPPGLNPPKPEEVKSEFELLDSDLENLIVSTNSSETVRRDGEGLNIHSSDTSAYLFTRPVNFDNYKVRFDVSPPPEGRWSGALGVLLGVNKSQTSPGTSLGYLVELFQDKEKGAWYLQYKFVVIDSNTNTIVHTSEIASPYKLKKNPNLSQQIECRIKNGKLHSVRIEGNDYGSIGMDSTKLSPTLPKLAKDHGVQTDQVRGQVGVLCTDSNFDIRRILVLEY